MGVEVEVGSGPSCNLQAESKNMIQIAESTIRNIEWEFPGRILGWKIILFYRKGNFDGKSNPVHFAQFGVGQTGRQIVFSVGWTGLAYMQCQF